MASSVNTDWNAVITSAQSQISQINQQLEQLKAQAAAKQGDAFKAASAEYVALAAKRDAELKVARDQIGNINSQIATLRDQAGNVTPTFEQLTDARKASEADPNNAALKATYERIRAQRTAALAPYNQKVEELEKQRLALVTKQNQIEAAYAPQLKAIQAKQNAAQDLIKAEVNQAIQLEDKKGQLEDQINEAQRQLTIQKQGTTSATTNTTSATSIPASNKPGNATVATTTTTTKSSNTSTKTTVTTTTNSTAISTDPSINKLLSTESLVDAQGQPTTSSDPSINKLLTDANKPLVDETGAVKPTDPSIVALVDTPPLVQIDEVKLQEDIANIKVDVPDITSIPTEVFDAQSRATAQDEAQFAAAKDWRVRLALAPGADYFYAGPNAGILAPLKDTDGVIFPYTPAIAVNYTAKYDETSLTHSNYKVYQYSSSAVEQVSITCDFTAQDTAEAKYLLAVIHFFRSMTKMFYGQDKKPRNGTPPPLCYMYGMGGYQFAAHPLAITGFSYNLPNDVDYIKTTGSAANQPFTPANRTGGGGSFSGALDRLAQLGASIGGKKPATEFNTPGADSTAANTAQTTWVPTKINMAITCLPIMSRNQVSNNFSLDKYASGNLLLGTQNKGGGMW